MAKNQAGNQAGNQGKTTTLGKPTFSTKRLTQLAILTAIEAIIAFVPILGSIPIGPMVATTAHLPVILAGVLLGTSGGAFMGFVFGLLSFIVNSFVTPTITSFVFTPIIAIGDVPGNFWSIVICFVPRILLGVAASLLYQGLQRFDKRGSWSYIVTGVLSSFIHTVLVLFGIYIFFKDSYAGAYGMASSALLPAIGTVIGTNGVLEAVLAGVVTIAVAKPVQIILKRSK